MKLKKLFFVACNLFGVLSFAQVGINTTTPNALLDIRASSATAPTNTDGLLIPKIDVFPATNPTADQQGMLVYLTTTVGTNTPGFYYWDNPTTTWIGLGKDVKAWQLNGNTVNGTTDFMGSTNDADVIFKRNNVHAGRIGIENTSFGVNALNPASTGSQNTAFGNASLYYNTTGYQNTASGASSLSSNTEGYQNTASGNASLYSNTTGYQNTAFGNASLPSNTTGSQNTAFGASSLYSNSTGNNNTASGASSLSSNTTGNYNTASGASSLYSNTTGNNNTASGASSLSSNTTGYENTASGASSLSSNTEGYQNTASGAYSLYSNTTGTLNTASGAFSLYSNTTGYDNTASGTSSLRFNTEGYQNTASGASSLSSNTTGDQNTASGAFSLYSNTTGNYNTASGVSSLYSNTTGNYNTAIGYNAFFSGDSFSNSTALGANTTITASDQVRLGNNAVTSIGGQVDWTTLSDSRFKTENAAKVPGFDFIKKLRPVTYYVDHEAMNRYLEAPKGEDVQNRSSLEAKNTYKPSYTKTLESGFMAQEVEQAAKELGYEFNGVDAPKNDKDYYGLRYDQFVVPLVKAVLELNEKLEQKDAENEQLRAMLLELEKRSAKLEKNASN